MKKYIFSIFLFLMLSSPFILADIYEESYNVQYDIETLQIQMIKYDPFPVNPGEYFNLWINVRNTGVKLDNVIFELDSQYPFTLDPNEEAIRELGQLNTDAILLKYKVRVSADAVEGNNELTLRYKTGTATSWQEKKFDIYVSDAQTKFDGVIQEIEGNTITLALANTGKNVANS